MIKINFFLYSFEKKEYEKLVSLKYLILEKFNHILSKHLDLDANDDLGLCRVEANKSIATFLDSFNRLKKKNFTTKKKSNLEEGDLINFFKDPGSFFYGDSYLTRCRIINLILKCINFEELKFEEKILKKISINDLNLKKNYFFNFLFLIKRIKNFYINKKFFFSHFKIFQRKNRLNIGYINLGLKNNNKEINFIKINSSIHHSEYLTLEKINFYNEYKNLFFLLIKNEKKIESFFSDMLNEELIYFLFLLIIYRLDNVLFSKNNFNSCIQRKENFLKKNKIKLIINDGSWFKTNNALIGIAAKKNNIPIFLVQQGGECLYYRGIGHDWYTKEDPNNFVNKVFYWSGNSNFFSRNSKNYIKISNYKLQLQKRKKFFFTKDINILYSPTSLSHIFDINMTQAMKSTDMKTHREFMDEIISSLDSLNFPKTKINLYVKLKGFGETIFKDFEWMFFHKMNLKNINVFYLTKGISKDYFDLVDIHIYDGPSTSLAHSIASDIPSVCIWNKSIFNVRSEYNELFKLLKKNQLVCSSSEELLEILYNILLKKNKKNFNIEYIKKNLCRSNFSLNETLCSKISSEMMNNE